MLDNPLCVPTREWLQLAAARIENLMRVAAFGGSDSEGFNDGDAAYTSEMLLAFCDLRQGLFPWLAETDLAVSGWAREGELFVLLGRLRAAVLSESDFIGLKRDDARSFNRARLVVRQLAPKPAGWTPIRQTTIDTLRCVGGSLASFVGDTAALQIASDDDAFLSPKELAARFKLSQGATEQRLNRWREKHTMDTGDFVENMQRGPRDPQFLYRLGAVRPVLDKPYTERTAKKNLER